MLFEQNNGFCSKLIYNSKQTYFKKEFYMAKEKERMKSGGNFVDYLPIFLGVLVLLAVTGFSGYRIYDTRQKIQNLRIATEKFLAIKETLARNSPGNLQK